MKYRGDSCSCEGISTPISRILKDFRFLLLEHCGHNPWYEKEAREPFFAFLKQEITYLCMLPSAVCEEFLS